MRLSHAIAGIRTLINEEAAQAVANNRVRTSDGVIIFFIKRYLHQRASFRPADFDGYNSPDLASRINGLAAPNGASDPDLNATYADSTYPIVPINESGGWGLMEGVYKMLNLRNEEPTRPEQAEAASQTIPPGDGSGV